MRRAWTRAIWRCRAGGGVGTVRATAHAYSVFATGRWQPGSERDAGLAVLPRLHETKRELEVWRRVFLRSPGTGGALGFADPDARIGYDDVTSRVGTDDAFS